MKKKLRQSDFSEFDTFIKEILVKKETTLSERDIDLMQLVWMRRSFMGWHHLAKKFVDNDEKGKEARKILDSLSKSNADGILSATGLISALDWMREVNEKLLKLNSSLLDSNQELIKTLDATTEELNRRNGRNDGFDSNEGEEWKQK